MMNFVVQQTINMIVNINFKRYSSNVTSTTLGYWNNIDFGEFSLAVPNVMVADLIDDTNTLSGIGITNNNLTEGESYGVLQALEGGEAADSPYIMSDVGLIPGVIHPRGISRDWGTVTAGDPLEFKFTGLDGTKLYNFKVFSNSFVVTAGRTYDTVSTAIGANTVISNTLTEEEVMGVIPSSVMQMHGIEPDVSDEIVLQIAKGPNAGAQWVLFCNAIILEEVTP